MCFCNRLKRSISDDEGNGGNLLDPTLDLVAWPDSARATDDEDRIRDEVSEGDREEGRRLVAVFQSSYERSKIDRNIKIMAD